MKLFIRLLLIAIFSYLFSLFLPWWIIAVVGFMVGWLVPGGLLSAFVSGFLGVAIVWVAYAWKLDTANESAFSSLILQIIPLGQPLVLIVVAGMIGGLVGAFSTLSGAMLRSKPKKKSASGYYQ
jgi:hypothetical protein